MATTERSGHTTTDHDFIRQWVEERGGWPARVKGTEGKDDAGLIRVDFPGYSGEGRLEKIDWADWFEAFDENKLAFLHRDMSHGAGDLDRFNKLVRRGTGTSTGRGRSAAKKTSSTRARKTATTRSSAGSTRADTGTARKRTTAAKKSSTAAKSSTSSRSSRSAKKSSSRDSGDMTRLRELLLHELGDLLYAERRFLTSTRTMAREAQEKHLKARLEAHVTETEGQIERLQEAFRSIGERPRAEKCEAAIGLKEEHDSFKSEEKPSASILSAFDLGSGLRVEHYEIAGYRSAIAIANALGEKECAALLKESLKEETAMASFLEKNAPLALRRIVAEEKAGESGSMLRALRNAVGV